MSKRRLVKSPGKLSNSIDKMTMEETPTGVTVTVYYKHHYIDEPDLQKATITINKADRPDYMQDTITGYMHEIGVLFGLEDGNKTVDWKLVKEIDDDYLKSHPDCNENNLLQVVHAPGKTLWVADSYQ